MPAHTNETASKASKGTTLVLTVVKRKQSHSKPSKHSYAYYVRYRVFTIYRRIFSVVFLANLAAFILICTQSYSAKVTSAAALSSAISANLFVAVLFRTEDFINFLYKLSLRVPLSTPLYLRRYLAKVYGFGGFHSGTGVAATIWTVLFTVQVTRAFISESTVTPSIIGITYTILIMLISIIITAHPAIRAAHHDTFELVHRFCGWSATILYWALNILLAQSISRIESQTLVYTLFNSPTIYFLIVITLLLFLPWLRLRPVKANVLERSSHAVRLYFPDLVARPTQTIRLSTSPLFEWHSFAIIPYKTLDLSKNPSDTQEANAGDDSTRNGSTKTASSHFSVIVSAAGDWTRHVIANTSIERKFYFRGIPTTGMTHSALLFRSAVIVATGSGIGPALSLLFQLNDRLQSRIASDIDGDKECCKNKYRLVWSTRSPLQTYGMAMLEDIRRVSPDAVIWDTVEKGRPDLVNLALSAFLSTSVSTVAYNDEQRAGSGSDRLSSIVTVSIPEPPLYEAVFVVSNQSVTKATVYELEKMGIPAYGPIFDS
jgi:hypothetical protein